MPGLGAQDVLVSLCCCPRTQAQPSHAPYLLRFPGIDDSLQHLLFSTAQRTPPARQTLLGKYRWLLPPLWGKRC